MDGQTPTWTCNVVLHRPHPMPAQGSMALSNSELLAIGQSVRSIILAADTLPPTARQEQIVSQLKLLSRLPA
jgi:hypothetical protein